MLDNVRGAIEAIKIFLTAFRDTDFGQVAFGSPGLALGAALFLLAAVLYKLLWGRDKFRHFYSGHRVPEEYRDPLWRKLICLSPFAFLVLSVIFLLLALANLYLPRTVIEEEVESREMVELIDNSSSMGWEFENTGKSACEVAREGHLKFREMRRGQNDRVALWVFSNNAYKIEDFIIDDDVYVMQVRDAPCIMVSSGHQSLPENDPIGDEWIDIVAPRDKVRIIDSESGTNLVAGLKAVIQYFDQEGRRDIKKRSLILITDAAVENIPETEFKELQKRNITAYMVHVKPNEIGEKQFNFSFKSSAVETLKDRVRQLGGIVFEADDEAGMERAFAEINRMETSPVNIKRHLLRVLIYQRPLAASFVLAMLSILSGLTVRFFWEAYP